MPRSLLPTLLRMLEHRLHLIEIAQGLCELRLVVEYIPSAAAARDRRPQTPATYNRAEFFQISGEQMKDLTDEERARLARQISSTQSAIWLDPAAIDDVILVGAGAAVVGGEEEDDAGDVVRHELALKALALHDFGLTVGRQPQILLPLGHDPSGQDGIDPHVVRPKIAGERTG